LSKNSKDSSAGSTDQQSSSSDEKDVAVRVGDNLLPRDTAIQISQGEFGWTSNTQPVLKNVNLSIPRGKLTLVVGPVGCGKSTLLKAILGEVPHAAGTLTVTSDSVAYCDQTPWIVNSTFKENIVMFSEPDEQFYSTVLASCALRDDLTQLSDGDCSNLGSSGITLSGGQKQRLVRLNTLLFGLGCG
jgi:ATP-binding cassette subfamily C (CFTR/MRP) protein 1